MRLGPSKMFLFASALAALLYLSDAQLSPTACSNDSCWRPSASARPKSEGMTETAAVAVLRCFLQCGPGSVPGAESNTSCNCTSGVESMILPLLPSPSNPPLVTPSQKGGVYTVSIPDEGSGGGSGSGLSREAYLVWVLDQHGNQTHFPIENMSRSRDIPLLEFACSEVSISYAAVTEDSLSGYSPPQNVCILLPPGRGSAAENLTVEFVEDLRPGFRQHAFLHVSWDPPEDLLHVERYELLIENIPRLKPLSIPVNELHCSQQKSVIIQLEKGITNFTVTTMNEYLDSLPTFPCSYRVTLSSLPGYTNNSVELQVAYQNSGGRPKLMLQCIAIYDPETVSYNIMAVWRFRSSLIAEAIRLVTVTIDQNIVDGNVILLGTHNRTILDRLKAGKTEFNVTFKAKVLAGREEYVVKIKLRRPRNDGHDFLWRERLVPADGKCLTSAPPFPPSEILADTIQIQNVSGVLGNKLEFTVLWKSPRYINGKLASYQFCLGQQPVNEQERCPSSSNEVCVSARTNSDCGRLTEELPGVWSKKIVYSLGASVTGVALQIRATNLYSLSGNWSSAVMVNTSMPPSSNRSVASVDIWVYVVGVVVLPLLVSVLVVVCICTYQQCCFHRRIELGEVIVKKSSRRAKFRPTIIPVADHWEVKREDIELLMDEPLGKGAFGQVYQALVHPKILRRMSSHTKRLVGSSAATSCIVAVKILKDNSITSEKANFLKEIEMMKKVSGTNSDLQKFVVNMVGCVTIEEPMLLILEFVTHGDLLSYLRSIRKKAAAVYFNDDMKPNEAAPYLEPVGVYSKLKPQDEDYEELGLLDERHLLEFARQIAAGMEYLSSLGIVHRDLACRNILVGEGKVLKVSDFGMSRLLPPDEVYVPTSHGLLPLRWMAIEALFYRHFTTMTDIWSYGVVIWEICTMGGFPYPTLSNRDLPQMLKTGYRMQKPETCSPEVYEVMLECWSDQPNQRPTFPKLHQIFDKYLGKHTQDRYPYIELLSKPYHFDKLEPKVPDPEQTPVNLDFEVTDVDEVDVPADRVQQGHIVTISPVSEPNTDLLTTHNSPYLSPHFSLQPSPHRSPLASLHSSRQDIRAELIRQLSWERDGAVGEDVEMENTRYVGSPLRNGTNKPREYETTQQQNFAEHLEQRLTNLPQKEASEPTTLSADTIL